MAVPILQLRSYLIAPLPSAVTDADMLRLQDEVSERAGDPDTHGLILDVSVVDVMDSFATRMLRSIAQTARLRGTEAVIVGIRPEVAFAMVQLGLTLDVATALDLDEAVDYLDAILAPREGSAGV